MEKSKFGAAIAIIMGVIVVFEVLIFTVEAADTTVVSIDPSSQIVSPGDNFTVDVFCAPGQPIKAFEFRLAFDSSVLQATLVDEGDIFDGYTTFFNSGTIDNNASAIVDVYGLIIGSGNVSGSGTFVTISFTATSALGTSTLNLYDVGVTNETGYVSTTVNDGSVTVQGTNNPPNMSSIPSGPSTRDVGESGTYSTSATDSDGDQVQYRFDWDASGGHVYSSWTSLGASGHTGSLSHSWGSAGTYVVMAQARDEHGASSSWSSGLTIVVSEASSPPSPPSNSPPGSGSPPPESPPENNPSEQPSVPSGPTFVEIGVEYTFTGSTVDVDGDQIRYRFDWGDSNYSSWSDLVNSNISVSMSYDWNSISTYEVRVIAQDENGLNSSWSPPLNVTVSQVDSGELPVVDAGGPYNISANQTVSFDASNSYVPDGVVIYYEWDFGDGENGSGINPTHVYQYPGEYTVTLVITDSNGDAYSTSILVTVDSEVVEQQAEEKGILPFYFGYIFIGVALVMLVCLAFFFRMTIKSFVPTYIASLFSQWKLRDMRDKIAKINNKIKLIKKKKVTKTDFKLPPVGIEDTYPDKIQNRYDGICKFIDYGISSTSEEKKSFDEFDGLQIGENVDKLIRMELQPGTPPTASVSDIDMGARIDRLILSGGRKSLHKFDSDSVFSEFEIESIERKVDDIVFSKIRQKIDVL